MIRKFINKQNDSSPLEKDPSFCIESDILNLFCKSENDKMEPNKKRD